MFKTFPVPFNNVDMSKGLGHVFNQVYITPGKNNDKDIIKDKD